MESGELIAVLIVVIILLVGEDGNVHNSITERACRPFWPLAGKNFFKQCQKGLLDFGDQSLSFWVWVARSCLDDKLGGGRDSDPRNLDEKVWPKRPESCKKF